MIDTLGRKGLHMIAFRCKEARKGERGDSEGNIGFGGVLSSGRGGVTNGKRGSEHVCASPACTAYHVFHIWKCNQFSECDRADDNSCKISQLKKVKGSLNQDFEAG